VSNPFENVNKESNMKHLKLLVLVIAFSLAGVYCDSGGADKAVGAGGPDVTPEEIIQELGDIDIAEAEDVLVAVGDQIEKALEDYEGEEEAEDAAEEDKGEAVTEDQGEAIADEEGDVAEEPAEEPAEEVAEEEAKEEPAEEVAEEEAKEEPAEEVAEEETEEEPAEEVAEEEEEQTGEVATEVEGDDEEQAEEAEEDAEEGEVDIKGMTVSLDPTVGRWFKVETKELDTVSKGERQRVKNMIKKYRNDIKVLRKDMSDKKADKGKGKSKGKDKADTSKIQANIDSLLAKIKDLRNSIGYGSKQKGIYTYWGNEDLRLMARNVEVEGWYRLRIVAKNYGDLPKWYDQFTVSIVNESEGTDVGGISIKASDKVYHRGSVLVYLEKGDTDFNLLWKNDAYKKGEYDANIQIKRVTLRYAKKNNSSMKRLVRNAHEYSTVDGRFFWDKKTAWTNWADQTIGFSFPELEAGKYEIIIMAKNYGDLPLPDGYDNFIVAVDADGTSGEAMISAAQKGWRKGSVVLDLTGGTDVYLTWLNDQYKEGDYDTNIQYKKIFLKRVGDSERSALAAYLLGTRSGNRVLMSGILVVLVGFIALISVWNRRRANTQA
jgi:hypothetical protein